MEITEETPTLIEATLEVEPKASKTKKVKRNAVT